jgi:hypothetical protein
MLPKCRKFVKRNVAGKQIIRMKQKLSKKTISEFEKSIANGNVEFVLDKLFELDFENRGEVLILTYKYKKLEKEKSWGGLEMSYYQVESSKILMGILELIKEIEIEIVESKEEIKSLSDLEEMIDSFFKSDKITFNDYFYSIVHDVINYGSDHYNKGRVKDCIYIYKYFLDRVNSNINNLTRNLNTKVKQFIDKKVKVKEIEDLPDSMKAMYLREGIDFVLNYRCFCKYQLELNNQIEKNENIVSEDYNIRNSVIINLGIEKIMDLTSKGCYRFAEILAEEFLKSLKSYFLGRKKWHDSSQKWIYKDLISMYDRRMWYDFSQKWTSKNLISMYDRQINNEISKENAMEMKDFLRQLSNMIRMHSGI